MFFCSRRAMFCLGTSLFTQRETIGVDIFFATHQVTVEGKALDRLLKDMVEKAIFCLVEPGRAYKHQYGVVSHIMGLKVRKLEV